MSKIVDFVLDAKNNSLTKTDLQLEVSDIIIFHKTSHTSVYLSQHQPTCLKLLAQGKSSKEVARDMNISYRTVEGHITNIMELLGCTSSKELIALYYDQPGSAY